MNIQPDEGWAKMKTTQSGSYSRSKDPLLFNIEQKYGTIVHVVV